MVNKINEQEFKQKVNVEKKVIVDCYADWCGPCKMLAPIMDEVSENNQQYDFYKLNVDEANEIPRKYGIMSIPTILIFENGNLKEQLVGFRTKDELEKIINK
ncbi:MAG: thioredoxin [Bacilli bacterium]|nr:thioredoxin [Bacilli bacterium]